MIDTLLDLLSYPFMQHAIEASILTSFACGIVGTFVVYNRLTFLAGGASHAAYGGIGIALFFNLPVLICTLLFSLSASLLMASISLKNEHNSDATDTATGVLWAAGMAFGIVLIEMTPGYAGELMGFLFGSILAVTSTDLQAMLFFDLALVIIVFLFRQGLWAISLDSEFATARGLPTKALYLLLVAFTAIAVVMLIRVVGLILVLALLTIPPYIAKLFCKSLYGTMIAACILSLLFCLSGLTFSWYTNISSGASIITVATAIYLLTCLPLKTIFIGKIKKVVKNK